MHLLHAPFIPHDVCISVNAILKKKKKKKEAATS